MLDALTSVAPVTPGAARSYLARFLFRGDDVLKPVSELSGGERSRLELALLGVGAVNLLLLDEPTNHLDIAAREALEAFLRESGATLIVVSHDRRLLESTCDRLWVVEPSGLAGAGRGGTLRSWLPRVAGGRGRWLDRGRGPRATTAARGAPARSATERPYRTASSDSGTSSRAERAAAASRRTPIAASTSASRPTSTDWASARPALESALEDPGVQSNFVELRRLGSELAEVDGALNQAEDAWLTLEERAPR